MRWLALLLLAVPCTAFAQAPDSTFDFVEVPPVLIGLGRGIEYPEADRNAGVEGRVLVRLVVTAAGTAEQVEVVRSVSAGLDAAALTFVRGSRFEPGREGGRAVRVRLVLPVAFRLGGSVARPSVARPSVAALSARLGQPCCDAAADSGAVRDGAGRLLWRAPEPGVASAEADVAGDTLRALTVTYLPEGPSPVGALAQQIAESGVQPHVDGFTLAFDLSERSMSTAADIRLDAPRNRLTLRHPACRPVPGAGCYSTFPIYIGGPQGVQQRIEYPDVARRSRTGGVVVVAFVVQPDGSATDIRVASSTARGLPGGREMGEAAIRAVRESRFVLPPGKGPVPFAIPLRFQIR